MVKKVNAIHIAVNEPLLFQKQMPEELHYMSVLVWGSESFQLNKPPNLSCERRWMDSLGGKGYAGQQAGVIASPTCCLCSVCRGWPKRRGQYSWPIPPLASSWPSNGVASYCQCSGGSKHGRAQEQLHRAELRRCRTSLLLRDSEPWPGGEIPAPSPEPSGLPAELLVSQICYSL